MEYIYKHSKTLVLLTLSIYIILFINFTKDYFINFSENSYPYFDNETIDVFNYIKEKNPNNKKIYTRTIVDQQYIYNVLVNPISPYDFNESIIYKEIPNGKSVIGYRDCLTSIDFNNLEDDAIYVLVREDEASKIEKEGFIKEKYKKYYILYKE